MKKLNGNLITKVLIPLLCTGMLISVIGIVLSFREASIQSNQIAVQRLQHTTKTIQLTVEKELQAYVHSLNTLKNIIDGKEMINAHDKQVITDGLEILLDEYEELFGGWAIIEPYGTLDAQKYKNTPLHDADGRFAPYIEDVAGERSYQTLTSHKKEGEANYFHTKPLETGEIYVTSAITYDYKGQPVTVISICMPFEVGGKIGGVIGVDLEIKALTKCISSYKVYENGYAVLFDRDYTILAHPRNEFLGMNPYNENRMREMEKQAIDQTRDTLALSVVMARAGGDGVMAYKTFMPVQLHPKVAPYIVQIVVPTGEVLEGIAKLRISMMLVGIGIIILISFIIQRLMIMHAKQIDDEASWLRYLSK